MNQKNLKIKSIHLRKSLIRKPRTAKTGVKKTEGNKWELGATGEKKSKKV